MKYIFILLLFYCPYLFSQEKTKLIGHVFNIIKETPIERINVRTDDGANPKVTINSGRFVLIFPDKKHGDRVSISVNTPNYYVVNVDVLSNIVLGVQDITIYLCPTELCAETRAKYKETATQTIKKSKTEKKNQLNAGEKLGFSDSFDSLPLKEALKILMQRQDSAFSYTLPLADFLTHTYIADQSAPFKRSLEFFKELNLEKALKTLNGINLEKQLEKKANDIAFKRDYNLTIFKGYLHILNLEFEKAERLFSIAKKHLGPGQEIPLGR